MHSGTNYRQIEALTCGIFHKSVIIAVLHNGKLSNREKQGIVYWSAREILKNMYVPSQGQTDGYQCFPGFPPCVVGRRSGQCSCS